MVGHTFLYSSAVRWLKGAIDAGDLGRLRYLSSQRVNLGRIRTDCNALWNFGPHDISILHYFLGERVAEVSANGFAFLQPGIADVCFVTLRFPSGIAASVHLSWIDPRKTRLMTVVGDRQMAVYDDVSPDRKIWLYDRAWRPSRARRSVNSPRSGTSSGGTRRRRAPAAIEMKEPLLAEMEAFGEACRTGEPALTDARHGADVVRVLCAAEKSMAKGGSPVEVDW